MVGWKREAKERNEEWDNTQTEREMGESWSEEAGRKMHFKRGKGQIQGGLCHGRGKLKRASLIGLQVSWRFQDGCLACSCMIVT